MNVLRLDDGLHQNHGQEHPASRDRQGEEIAIGRDVRGEEHLPGPISRGLISCLDTERFGVRHRARQDGEWDVPHEERCA